MAVVICTRNRPDDLRRALTSIAWQTAKWEELLIVDDSDAHRRHDTSAACVMAGVDARLLTKDEPGLTASRNLAIDHIDSDIVLFLDDDVVLRPDYLEHMVGAFAADDDLAGAGGTIDDDHDYELPWLRGLLMLPGRTTGRVYPSGWSSQSPRGVDRPVEHLIGCNMAFRTSVLRANRFDVSFGGYGLGEDLELTHRLHLAGRRLRSVGAARLWHLTGLPNHDRAWGYRETVIRPIVAGRRFNRAAFALSALCFVAVNSRRNRARAAGNLAGIRDVLRGRHDPMHQTTSKEERAA